MMPSYNSFQPSFCAYYMFLYNNAMSNYTFPSLQMIQCQVILEKSSTNVCASVCIINYLPRIFIDKIFYQHFGFKETNEEYVLCGEGSS